MNESKTCDKVVAELTYGNLMEIAKKAGQPLSKTEAIRFLSQRGRATEIWRRMLAAGEDCLKEWLTSRPTPWPHRTARHERRLHYGE